MHAQVRAQDQEEGRCQAQQEPAPTYGVQRFGRLHGERIHPALQPRTWGDLYHVWGVNSYVEADHQRHGGRFQTLLLPPLGNKSLGGSYSASLAITSRHIVPSIAEEYLWVRRVILQQISLHLVGAVPPLERC